MPSNPLKQFALRGYPNVSGAVLVDGFTPTNFDGGLNEVTIGFGPLDCCPFEHGGLRDAIARASNQSRSILFSVQLRDDDLLHLLLALLPRLAARRAEGVSVVTVDTDDFLFLLGNESRKLRAMFPADEIGRGQYLLRLAQIRSHCRLTEDDFRG